MSAWRKRAKCRMKWETSDVQNDLGAACRVELEEKKQMRKVQIHTLEVRTYVEGARKTTRGRNERRA